jgi:hypothetical protein
VLAAGAGAFERADTYGVDLLVDPRDAGEPRTMLASYVETAQQVAKMSEAEFFMRFGEVARVVRQLGGSADENARKVYDLYRRHALEVVRVVEVGLSQHVSRILERSLPESCLLRLVHDPGVPPEWGHDGRQRHAAEAAPAEPDYFLRRRGQAWEFRFAGHGPQTLLPLVGVAYLRELLRFPNKQFTVSELLVAVNGDQAVLPLGDGDQDVDQQAKRAYLQRLHELEEDLEEARATGNVPLQHDLSTQREQLLSQLRCATFRGRARRSNADLNRIRNSVGNAVRRTLRTIEKYDPSAFDHLKKSISLGFSVAYQPAEALPWSF